jgi:hypothetical protein
MTLFPAQALNAQLCSVFVRLESSKHVLEGSWSNLDEGLLSAMHVAARGEREEEVQRGQRAEGGQQGGYTTRDLEVFQCAPRSRRKIESEAGA